ncbi:MAG: hypothetical protein WBH51_21935 [Mycolicibacter algericus]|uniref:Uncharacterized protein n=2 Tax=Mycobacteriaceae TaxID=1762 RepID=A0A7I9YCC3_MYCAL|nr:MULTISPECIES: hypothetical protein [Mycobacteriaceae]BBX13762.1 hypothetical protein MNVM_28430 [Mycobacterium novum]GFG86328.1 hypothetical protein MALGJ_30040 [Mycolicibacter algericus]
MQPAPVIGSILAGLTALGLGISPVATAEPKPDLCFDPRLCGDLSTVYYCPDTGQVVGAFAPCPSLRTGPYRPGGLQPGGTVTPLG